MKASGLLGLVSLVMLFFLGATPLPYWLAWGLGLANTVAFLLFGWDKLQARVGQGRIPERVLHLASLCGGAIGANLGRWWFHHKTRKDVFSVWGALGLVVLVLLQHAFSR